MKLSIWKTVSRLLCLCVVLACAASPLLAQRSMGASVSSFYNGEELTYEAEFSRALLRNVDIADFRFTAFREPSSSQAKQTSTGLVLTGDIATKGFFSKLFNLRIHEHIESNVDPVAFSVLRTTKLDEQGKRVRVSEAVFDRSQGKITWTERDPNQPQQQPRVATASFTGTIQDVVSAIYFVRMQTLEVGKPFEIQVSDSGRVYRLPVNVVERRRIKTVLGRINTIRVNPELFGNERLIRGKGKLSVWLSDDQRRIPVRAHLSNDLGTFEIKLKHVSTIPQPH